MADQTNTTPTPTRRAALSGSVAALAGTAPALLGGRSATAAVGLAWRSRRATCRRRSCVRPVAAVQ
jgi:hypothetical protein